MGNQNPSKAGFGMISAGRLKQTRDWLDVVNWDRAILLEMVETRQVAPFEPPKLVTKEHEEYLRKNPGKKETGIEKCPICLLYFRKGLNECTVCAEQICSHCYFRAKAPPRLWLVKKVEVEGEIEKKEREWVDESLCIFCHNCPWKVYFDVDQEVKNDEKRKKAAEMVKRQRQVIEDQQKLAQELFQKINERKKITEEPKKKKKKAKKKKKKDEDKEEKELTEEEKDEERLKQQMEKMLPQGMDINDIVETEEKMMEAALEKEMEEKDEVPDIESKEYKKIKKTVGMAMYGTIKKMKVEELRRKFERGEEKKEVIKKVLFKRKNMKKEENEEEEEEEGEEEKEEEFMDFLL